jgi:hypothetical protein
MKLGLCFTDSDLQTNVFVAYRAKLQILTVCVIFRDDFEYRFTFVFRKYSKTQKNSFKWMCF